MALEEEGTEEVQRWTAKRRAALVISLLKGETTVVEAARRHGLKVAEVEDWRERFVSLLSPRPVLPLLSGSIGTTPSALTRRLAIAARGNSARFNPNLWLDSGGALQTYPVAA